MADFEGRARMRGLGQERRTKAPKLNLPPTNRPWCGWLWAPVTPHSSGHGQYLSCSPSTLSLEFNKYLMNEE